MTYYKIICWSECPYCLQAKMVMIDRPESFEYCSVDHSPKLLDYYKTIYKYETVPMIVEINQFTGQEKFIGGYSDLIKYFEQSPPEGQVCEINTKG